MYSGCSSSRHRVHVVLATLDRFDSKPLEQMTSLPLSEFWMIDPPMWRSNFALRSNFELWS